MKTLILRLLPLLMLFVWPDVLKSQITTTIGSVISCPGEIAVPVNVTNCNGIGAISLVLSYDNSKLTYLGYQNLNSALTVGLLIINSTGNSVIVSWANTTAANLGNSTLVQLRFTAIPGVSDLIWDTQTPGNCEFSNISGTVLPATFSNGTATVNQPPVITTQPADRTALVSQNTSFSLAANGTGLEYLWQLSTNGGSTWIDLVNNAIYSGVTTSSLGITNVLLVYNGYRYRCRLTGTCAPVVYSNVVTLSVINPITTTLPTAGFCPGNIIVPVSVTNFAGVASFSLAFDYNETCLTCTGYQNLNGALASGTFVANASGGRVYMTWSSTSAANISSGNLIELLFTAVTGTSSLVWDVTNDGNCEYSALNGTQLTSVFVNGNETIYGLPAITTQPVNRTIAKSQNTTFSVTATGSGLAYIWQLSTNNGSTWTDLENNGIYGNVTTATMSISSVPLSMNGYQFRCKVSGTCTPFVNSNSALLTVLPNVFTTCQTVTGCPGSVSVPVNVTDFVGIGSFSLVLGYDNSVLTYTGFQNLNSTLTGGSFVCNANAGKVYMTWSSTTAFTLPTNAVLIELVFTGVPGNSSLNWDTQTLGNCEYANLSGQVIFSTWINGSATVNTPPSIGTQPVNKTIYAGGSTTFSVSATGTGLGYLWQLSTNGGGAWSNLSNTAPYSGVLTATLTINPVATGMNGYQYRCIVSGACTPSVTSAEASLTVTQAAISTTATGITNSCTGSLNIPINVTNCNNVGGISLTMIFDTTKMTFQGYHSVNSALNGGFLVVNRYRNKVYMSWASTVAVNIGTGVLIQFRFNANAGISSTLTWDTQTNGACEYSDPSGAIITSFYNIATVSVISNALIVNAGSDLSIIQGGSAQLNGSASGGITPYTYLWSPSTWLSNAAISNPMANPPSTTSYTLTVTGNNGCSGSDQMTVIVTEPPHSLNIKVYLQGLYAGSGTLNQAQGESGPQFGAGIADQVVIELHNPANYSQIIWTSGNLDLHTNGQIAASVPANFNGSYYLTVKHRNSITTTSANPVSLAGSTINYDFTTAASQAFGGNQLNIGGVFVFYGGDVTQDGYVDTGDMTPVDNDSANFASGYLITDVNGDGFVDTGDMTIIDNNSAGFVGSVTP